MALHFSNCQCKGSPFKCAPTTANLIPSMYSSEGPFNSSSIVIVLSTNLPKVLVLFGKAVEKNLLARSKRAKSENFLPIKVIPLGRPSDLKPPGIAKAAKSAKFTKFVQVPCLEFTSIGSLVTSSIVGFNGQVGTHKTSTSSNINLTFCKMPCLLYSKLKASAALYLVAPLMICVTVLSNENSGGLVSKNSLVAV